MIVSLIIAFGGGVVLAASQHELLQGEDVDYLFVQTNAARCIASSPALSLELTIDGSGLLATPSTVDRRAEASPSLSLRTTSIGRASQTKRLTSANRLVAEGNSVTLFRDGIEEWFKNDLRGIEHGWTLHESVPGHGALWIGIEIGGEYSAHLSPDGRLATLRSAGRIEYYYRDPHAIDAEGRELPCRLEAHKAQLGISVDDTNAVYPVTIDPLLSNAAWTFESNVVIAEAGRCLATAGDVNGDGYSDVIVGAQRYRNGEIDEGAAYLFLGGPGGPSLTPDWFVESNQVGADFGARVSTAGDINGDGYDDVLVSAPGHTGNVIQEGAVFIWMGGPNGLVDTGGLASADLVLSSDQTGSLFGASAAPAGDVNGDGFADVVVSAYSFDDVTENLGAVFLYLGSASGLTPAPAWTVLGDDQGHITLFGLSVASAGDVNADGLDDVVIGVPSSMDTFSEDGRIDLYLGTPGGLSASPSWTVTGPMVGGATSGLQFGTTVATAGDTNGDGYSDVVVGSHNWDDGASEINEGRATLLLGTAGGTFTIAGSVDGDEAGARFGIWVSTAGDVDGDGLADWVSAAYTKDEPAGSNAGLVNVYSGRNAVPPPTPDWTMSGSQAGEFFGVCVAPAGDVNGDGFGDVLIGSQRYTNGENNEGLASLYFGSGPQMPNVVEDWGSTGPQADSAFGFSVDSAGDVNGDGFVDLVVGDPNNDDAGTNAGAMFVYLGSPSGFGVSPDFFIKGDMPGDKFGRSVAGAGDVNGDGFDDVIVGAFLFDSLFPDMGVAQVHFGFEGGLSPVIFGPIDPQYLLYVDPQGGEGTRFGWWVDSAGDVNGDGYADVCVGAPDSMNDAGRVSVHYGSAGGVSSIADWVVVGTPFSRIGALVRCAGDVNRDGYSDLLVCSDGGLARVYLGGPSGLETSIYWEVFDPQSNSGFGKSAASAGDVDGNGYDDIVVGAWSYDGGVPDEGRVFLYLSDATGISQVADWTLEGDSSGQLLGFAVEGAGDLNSDGFDDVLIRTGGTTVGLFLGSSTGLGSTPDWVGESFVTGNEYGFSLGAAGDVDGDGIDDFIVGDKGFSPGPCCTFEGRVRLYRSNAGGGAPVLPTQLQGGGDRISIGGQSDSNGFRLELQSTTRTGTSGTPVGRARVGLEWQVESVLSDYEIRRTGRSETLTDTGGVVAPSNLVENPSFLDGSLQKWRARIVTDDPFYPHGPWVSGPGGPGQGRIRPDCAQGCGESLCLGSACPCGNDDPLRGCKNSTGVGARLRGLGFPSIQGDGLSLLAEDCPPGNLGLFLMADTFFETPLTVGDGRICIGGSSYRFAPQVVDPAGTMMQPSIIALAPPGFLETGSTVYFQAWTRDVFCTPFPFPCPSPCGSGSNLSQAIVILFVP